MSDLPEAERLTLGPAHPVCRLAVGSSAGVSIDDELVTGRKKEQEIRKRRPVFMTGLCGGTGL